MTLTSDSLAHSGKLTLETPIVNFVPGGLQPSALSPSLASVMTSNVSGKAGFKGDFSWNGAVTSSQGDLRVDGLNYTGATGVTQGLQGLVHFTSLAPLRSDPGQMVSIEHVQIGLPLSKLAFSVQFLGDQVALESARATSPGGLIALEPMTISLLPQADIKGAVAFNGLDFGQIVAATGLKDSLRFEGRLSGRLPFEISNGQILIADGVMSSDGPGKIEIKRTSIGQVAASGSLSSPDSKDKAKQVPEADMNPFQDLALQALEHITYDRIDATLNSAGNRKIDLNFHIKGYYDPPQPQKATITLFDYMSGRWMHRSLVLPSDTPVELFLDMPVNFEGSSAANIIVTPTRSVKP